MAFKGTAKFLFNQFHSLVWVTSLYHKTALYTLQGIIGGNELMTEAATLDIFIDVEGLRPLGQGLEEALLLQCATPLTTVENLSRFRRVLASTIERWGAEDEARLIELFKGGTKVEGIAIALHRQPGAIRSRLVKLGLLAV